MCVMPHCRADNRGPYSWTPVQGGPVPFDTMQRNTRGFVTGEEYTFQYRLPPGLTCENCVLQVSDS